MGEGPARAEGDQAWKLVRVHFAWANMRSIVTAKQQRGLWRKCPVTDPVESQRFSERQEVPEELPEL